jgi:phospholipase/carboxylesterase
MNQLGFNHRFIPSPSDAISGGEIQNETTKDNKSKPLTLLLLHGTGGNEDDLIPVGQMLSSSASLLSPRGKVLEHGMPRFFRRLAEGVFDIDDLKFRTQELAKFVYDASSKYSFDLGKTIAVGFSNGANIAASLLLMKPQVMAGAVLFRPMLPFIPKPLPDLSGKKVVILSGRYDPIVSREQAESLFSLLKNAGAKVEMQFHASGHELSQNDVQAAQRWLSTNF